MLRSFSKIILIIIVSTFLFIVNNNAFFNGFISIINILLFIIIFNRVYNSKLLLLFFIFVLTYNIPVFLHFSFGQKISFYELNTMGKYYENVLEMLFIFNLTVIAFLKKIKSNDIVNKLLFKDNKLLYIFNIIFMILIYLFAKTGDNMFISGGYGLVNASLIADLAIWEYFSLFFLLSIVYSSKNRFQIFLSVSIGVLYILKDISLGGRIASLQVIILIFILFFESKMNYKQFFIVLVSSFFIISFFGFTRSNVLNLFNFNKIGELDVLNLLANQSEVTYSSSILQGLAIDEYVDLTVRIKSLIGNIISVFLPSRFIFEEADIIWIASETFGGAGGGGMIISYFYLWLGPIGVILIATIVTFFSNKLYKTKNNYFLLYLIMVFSTFPRWFAYKPLSLYKLSGYIIPIYFLFSFIKYRKEEKL